MERELEWAQAAAAWARDVLGPTSAVVACHLHRDESAPHVHVTAVPRTFVGELGWKPRLTEWFAEKGILPGRLRDRYATLHDDFAEQVSERYGLSRGVRGGRAVHSAPGPPESG